MKRTEIETLRRVAPPIASAFGVRGLALLRGDAPSIVLLAAGRPVIAGLWIFLPGVRDARRGKTGRDIWTICPASGAATRQIGRDHHHGLDSAMIAFLIRWADRAIAHHPTANALALVAPLGMIPGVWLGWNGLTVAAALIWGCTWTAFFFWRLAAFLKTLEARKRRSDRQRALRAARKARRQ